MKVKGTSIRSRLEFVRARFGDAALEAVLDALADPDRRAVEKTLAASWVPFALLNRLDQQIVRGPGAGELALAREIGAFSAQRNLSSVYRMFVEQAGGDPAALLEGLATLHSSFYDWGSMRAVAGGPGRCRVEVEYAGAGLDSRHPVRQAWVVTPRIEARVFAKMRQPPPDASTHWSTRKLARELGISNATVSKIWVRAGLKPHRLSRYRRR